MKKEYVRAPEDHFEAAEGICMMNEGLNKVRHAMLGHIPHEHSAMQKWNLLLKEMLGLSHALNLLAWDDFESLPGFSPDVKVRLAQASGHLYYQTKHLPEIIEEMKTLLLKGSEK